MQNMKELFDEQVRIKVQSSVEKLEERYTEAKVLLADVRATHEATPNVDAMMKVSITLAEKLYGGHQLQKAKERLHKLRGADDYVVWAYNACANLADRIDSTKAEIEASLRGE